MNQSKENRKPYQDSEAEFHTELLLEEQTNQILSEAKSAVIMQISWVERSHDVIRDLNRLIHSHHVEMYHGDQEYGVSRRERAERAQRDDRKQSNQEMKELNDFCCSEAERAQ